MQQCTAVRMRCGGCNGEDALSGHKTGTRKVCLKQSGRRGGQGNYDSSITSLHPVERGWIRSKDSQAVIHSSSKEFEHINDVINAKQLYEAVAVSTWEA